MAPKKTAGEKGMGKAAGAKKKEKMKGEEGVGEAVPELDKHYYLNQIQSQADQLQAFQMRCRQVEAAENVARKRHDQLLQEKMDISSLLRGRLKARDDEVEELRSRLKALLRAGEEERTQYEARLEAQEKTATDRQLDLKDRLIALTRQVDSLEEFRQNKEQLEAKLEKLETTLVKERLEHRDQVSVLERSAILEADTLRGEVERRVAGLAGRFRKAAAAEMHSTTRRALHHNQALTSVLATLRARLLHLREENHRLRGALQEANIRERVQRDTVEKLSALGQKRVALLARVTERAELHAKQHQQHAKLSKEAEQLKKDLRLQQAQLDATTELTSQLKEKATERDIALELTSAKLLEEDAIKRSLLSTIRSALQILQTAMFQGEPVLEHVQLDAEVNGPEHESTKYSVAIEGLLKQLVELLTAEEEKATNESETDLSACLGLAPDPLLSYTAGDLGLVPRLGKRGKKDTPKNVGLTSSTAT